MWPGPYTVGRRPSSHRGQVSRGQLGPHWQPLWPPHPNDPAGRPGSSPRVRPHSPLGLGGHRMPKKRAAGMSLRGPRAHLGSTGLVSVAGGLPSVHGEVGLHLQPLPGHGGVRTAGSDGPVPVWPGLVPWFQGSIPGPQGPGHCRGRAAAPCLKCPLIPAPRGRPPQGGAHTGNKGDPENCSCNLVRNLEDPTACPPHVPVGCRADSCWSQGDPGRLSQDCSGA